jgi:hypothetical protein
MILNEYHTCNITGFLTMFRIRFSSVHTRTLWVDPLSYAQLHTGHRLRGGMGPPAGRNTWWLSRNNARQGERSNKRDTPSARNKGGGTPARRKY